MSSVPPSNDSDSFLSFITQEHSEGELRGYSFEKGRSSKWLRIQTKFSKDASTENCRLIEKAAITFLDQHKGDLHLKQIVALEKNMHTLQNITQSKNAVSKINDIIYEHNLGGLKSIQEKGLQDYVGITEETVVEAKVDKEELTFEEFGLVSAPPIHLMFEVIDILTEKNPEMTRRKIENFLESASLETLSTLIACIIPFITDQSAALRLCKNPEDTDRIQATSFSIFTTLLSRRGKVDSPEWAAFRAGLRDRSF